jgi:hypothetical protein
MIVWQTACHHGLVFKIVDYTCLAWFVLGVVELQLKWKSKDTAMIRRSHVLANLSFISFKRITNLTCGQCVCLQTLGINPTTFIGRTHICISIGLFNKGKSFGSTITSKIIKILKNCASLLGPCTLMRRYEHGMFGRGQGQYASSIHLNSSNNLNEPRWHLWMLGKCQHGMSQWGWGPNQKHACMQSTLT